MMNVGRFRVKSLVTVKTKPLQMSWLKNLKLIFYKK